MDILIFGFPAALLVIGLTLVVKQFVDSRFMPLVAVLFGIIIMVMGDWGNISFETFVQGIVVGLISCGLWDIGKKTIVGEK